MINTINLLAVYQPLFIYIIIYNVIVSLAKLFWCHSRPVAATPFCISDLMRSVWLPVCPCLCDILLLCRE